MDKRNYFLVASVYNRFSVLNRITSAFSKRHMNIESLNASQSLIDGICTIVVSAYSTRLAMERIVADLGSVYDILHVAYYMPEDMIHKELALYKISVPDGFRVLESLSRKQKGRVVSRSDEHIIIERSGTRIQLEHLKEIFENHSVLEDYSCSGTVVIHRDPLDNFYERLPLGMK